MFEAFDVLCGLAAATDGGVGSEKCRTALLPGYAAETKAVCEQAVRSRPPDWLASRRGSLPYCGERPTASLTFSEVAPGLFVHRGAVAEPEPENAGDVSNIAFVVGQKSVAVVDSGGSRKVGEEVYLAIRAVSDLPITDLVLTHMHPDHVFGAEPLKEAGAEILGHDNLPRALADRAATYETSFARLIGEPGFLGSRIVGPDRVIAASESIDLGDRVLDISSWPDAHTATDLTVHDRTSGVLIAGDLLFDEHAPAIDGSLLGWLQVLNDLKDLPAPKVVPGHGGPLLDWPESAAPLEHYLTVLARDSRAVLAEGLRLSEAVETIGQSEAGRWKMFELYNPRNATVAFTELEWD